MTEQVNGIQCLYLLSFLSASDGPPFINVLWYPILALRHYLYLLLLTLPCFPEREGNFGLGFQNKVLHWCLACWDSVEEEKGKHPKQTLNISHHLAKDQLCCIRIFSFIHKCFLVSIMSKHSFASSILLPTCSLCHSPFNIQGSSGLFDKHMDKPDSMDMLCMMGHKELGKFV